MSAKDKNIRSLQQKEEVSDSDQGGKGGQGGKIAFRDFTDSGQYLREDLLPHEKRHLLTIHKSTNEANVKKQKDKREFYKMQKETNLQKGDPRRGLGNGQIGGGELRAVFPPHPLLSNKAQFSGTDRQINMLPTENVADTNEVNRNELENQYRLRHAPQLAPTFNPKPQYNR